MTKSKPKSGKIKSKREAWKSPESCLTKLKPNNLPPPSPAAAVDLPHHHHWLSASTTTSRETVDHRVGLSGNIENSKPTSLSGTKGAKYSEVQEEADLNRGRGGSRPPKELNIETSLPVSLHCDNNLAIQIAANPVFHVVGLSGNIKNSKPTSLSRTKNAKHSEVQEDADLNKGRGGSRPPQK
nr:uncharacterized mitochondrial protein AtMg00810-like [Tanacetum cinerariifolium]